MLRQKRQSATGEIRAWVTDEQLIVMMDVLELVRTSEELILPSTDYVYFAMSEHPSYAKNYFAIQDHHFGTGLDSSFNLKEWLKTHELTN